jgi:uncharacterized membrane protein YphA (DoxX/SURF4 family)
VRRSIRNSLDGKYRPRTIISGPNVREQVVPNGRAPHNPMNIILWIIQVLLGLLFIFSGSMKFMMSVAEMNAQSPVVLPGIFIHFIGVCEILGGIGLILPSLLRIKPGLTPLAATGLAIITAGATVITLMGPMKGLAALPLVTCVLCIFVAYGRWRAKPIVGK